jgi:hypothetical protein
LFTDGLQTKSQIIQRFNEAVLSIDVAMAYFTDREIAGTLVNAAKRGVSVRVVLSSSEENENVRSTLKDHAVVAIYQNAGRGIMHHKFSIVDRKILLHGSYNYTYNAVNNNQESLNVTDSAELVQQYLEVFNRLRNEALEPNVKAAVNVDAPVTQEREDNYIERFNNELERQIARVFDQFDPAEVQREGRTLSEESNGSEAIYINYLDQSLASLHNRLEREDHTRQMVRINMQAALTRHVDEVSRSFDADVQNLKADHDRTTEAQRGRFELFRSRRDELNEELTAEEGKVNLKNGKKKELESQIGTIDSDLNVQRFISAPVVFVFGLIIFLLFPYLSVFFASAIWKILFEEAEIREKVIRGITNFNTTIIDADAIYKLFTKKGAVFGFIGLALFLIPVLLSSIKVFGVVNKWVELFVGWIIGIFLIDVVASLLISQHQFAVLKQQRDLQGEWNLVEHALKQPEFWMIFIFGALPLFITKVLIEYLWKRFKNSDPNKVNRARNMERMRLNQELTQVETEVNQQSARLAAVQERYDRVLIEIVQLENESLDSLNRFNELRGNAERMREEKSRNLNQIYNAQLANVDAGGPEFLKNALEGRKAAFSQGYYSYITEIYAEQEAARRIGILQSSFDNWSIQNFN